MNPAAIATRPYEAGDEAQVLALLRQALGGGRAFERTSAFWQWKHFQNPCGPSHLMVAANNQIVGLRAFMRWRFHDGVRVLEAVRAVDTATHPGVRRLGIFSKLTSLAVEQVRAEGVDLIFNTPNPVSLAGYLKLGWAYVGRPRLLVRILRPVRIARTLLARDADQDGHVPSLGAPSAPVEALLSEGRALATLLAEDDRLGGRKLRTIRTAAFMRWRYGDAPGRPYRACWEAGRALAAAVILRPGVRKGLREVVLTELLLGTGDAGAAVSMLRNVIASADVDYMVAHAPRGSMHARVLGQAGFVPVPRVGPYFTVRPLSAAASEMAATRLSTWHLSLGDLEVF